LIVNAEGWNHPSNVLVGEVLYVPDISGDKNIFGEKYRKVTLHPGTFSPISYEDRAGVLSRYDSFLDQTRINPFYARYKQIIPRSDFIYYLPSRETFFTILKDLVSSSDEIFLDLENIKDLLGVDFSTIKMGLTGSLLLGNIHNYHDLDLVFYGEIEQNIKIAKKMREIVKYEKHRRIVEGGKGWNIRFFNDRKKLMCNFFGYPSFILAPLKEFSMDVVSDDIIIEGTVNNDLHSIYTPTVLGLTDVNVRSVNKRKTKIELDDIPLIIYHTATRGECFSGDRVRAEGALVNIITKDKSYEAVCAIKREAVRNLTPTWEDYYNDIKKGGEI